MSTFAARPGPIPSSTLWRVTADERDSDLFRVIPDAVMDLVCFDGKLLFAGPDTTASLVPSSPGAVTWGLRFSPGMAHALLGMPVGELANQRIELQELSRLDAATLDALWNDPIASLKRAAVELWMRSSPDVSALNLAQSLVTPRKRG